MSDDTVVDVMAVCEQKLVKALEALGDDEESAKRAAARNASIVKTDISEHNVSVWDNNCWDDFAPPLHATWSAAILHRFPLLIDAYVSIGQARPDHLVTTAEIFTGVRPKYHLLWPTIAIPVLWEALLQMLCLSRPPQVAAGEKKGQ